MNERDQCRTCGKYLYNPQDAVLDRYQTWTGVMWFDSTQHHQTKVMIAALGMAGETGEVMELLKKHTRGDGPLDLHALELELGDVLYYITRLASLHGLKLDRILESNVEKIERRRERGTQRGSGSDR